MTEHQLLKEKYILRRLHDSMMKETYLHLSNYTIIRIEYKRNFRVHYVLIMNGYWSIKKYQSEFEYRMARILINYFNTHPFFVNDNSLAWYREKISQYLDLAIEAEDITNTHIVQERVSINKKGWGLLSKLF